MNVALITDFGTKDYFVGAMKGVILSISPDANIIDITHEVTRHDIQSACFTLSACFENFPAGTIFAVVVDPGVGSERRSIVVETPKYKFVAPDNGVLSFIFRSADDFKVYEISNDEFCLKPISQTFHGRDVFAPVAAHLSMGVETGSIGNEAHDFLKLEAITPKIISDTKSVGQIISIDRFGNLVTNLQKSDLPDNFVLNIGSHSISKVSSSYSEVLPGELLLILGSSGYFEVVVNQGSAKDMLSTELNGAFSIEKL